MTIRLSGEAGEHIVVVILDDAAATVLYDKEGNKRGEVILRTNPAFERIRAHQAKGDCKRGGGCGEG